MVSTHHVNKNLAGRFTDKTHEFLCAFGEGLLIFSIMKTRDLPRLQTTTPREIYQELDRFVIGQEEAKKVVAVAAYNHYKRLALKAERPDTLLRKSNMLLIGPTGCGKTHIARILARILDVPFTVCDATEYTEAGYYGKDVEVMIAELLFKTNQDVAATQRGIVFVDEIDKIARRGHGARTGAGSRDIGGEGVQQGMLKLLEGREIFVPQNVTQHWNKHDFVVVDTTDILFICAGTFSDLPELDLNRSIGFQARTSRRAARQRRVSQKSLTEYGMIAELLGRLPVIVQLAELSEPELCEILCVPPDSLLREYQELFAADDIQLDFRDEAKQRVVRHALDRRLGARGLRSIMEELMREAMFEAPEKRGQPLTIDAAFVKHRLAKMSG